MSTPPSPHLESDGTSQTPFKTPDTTTAQIVAYATAIIAALVVLFGLDVSDAQQAAAVTIIGAVVSAFHMWSDAKIRNGRAQIAAAQIMKGP